MAKHVQPGEDIRIAPGITGKRENEGELIIIDDWNRDREQLYPKDNIEHKIRIFKRQVKEWFLERASSLLSDEDNGFVTLMIATSYIEGIEQYRQGKSSDGNSKAFFKESVKRIFGIQSCFDSRLDDLYKDLRCELFHNGMTGPYIRIHSMTIDKPIDFSDDKIININQRLFLEKVEKDFEQYITDLKDTTKEELRNNFNKLYTFD